MLELSFLGAFQVSRHGQPPPQFQTNKVRALLAYLALEAGRPHDRATLVGLLWPEMPEANARNNLSKALGMLRRALGDGEHAPPYLTAGQRHVRFNAESDYWLDVAEFQQKTAGPATPPQLAEAVNLYHGEFLSGFSLPDAPAFEEWLLLWRERLHQQMLAALARLTTSLLEQGQPEEAVRYARRQLELDAWREAAHTQLMQALALSGHRSEALAQFGLCRALLAEELGVAPTAETIALYEAIKAGRISPLPQQRPPTHNLPAPQTPFIGREREVATLAALIHQPGTRLVTVVGPGGQGKTRLVLAYARGLLQDAAASPFPDGLYFVSLVDLDNTTETTAAEALLQTVAPSLSFSLATESEEDPRSPRRQLLDYLGQKKLLLLLDDLDPLLPEKGEPARLLGDILKAAPDVQIIATAREPLGLYGERVLPLAGLSLPAPGSGTAAALGETDAVRLFLQAARRIRPDFQLQPDEWDPLGRLCRFLGGLPLALELAASWTDVLPIPDILARLRRDLDLLSANVQGVAPHHQSIQRVLEQSWQQLAEDERQLLAALSVFRGGFTRDAAQAVALPPALTQADGLRLLHKLAQKSLIAYDRARDRYDLHELLRHFAAERLAQAAPLAASVAERHSVFYCRLLQARAPALTGPQPQPALAEIETEMENVRHAWRLAVARGEVARVAAALEGLFYFCDVRSRFREGEQLLREALAGLATGPAGRERLLMQARVQARAGWFAFQLGQPEEGISLLQESLCQLQQAGAEAETIFNLNYLGAVYRHQGSHDAAAGVLHRALSLARAHHDSFQASISLNILGQIASLRGEYDAARRYCREALALKREIGDRRGLTYALTYLGRVELAQADYDAARGLFEESMEISKVLGDRRGVAFAARNLGRVAQAQARYLDAEGWYGEALAISREIGNRLEAALSLIRWSQAATARDDTGPARHYLVQGLQEALAAGSQRGLLEALFALAQYRLQTGPAAEALACLAFIDHSPHAGPALQAQARELAQAAQGSTAFTLAPAAPDYDLASFVNAALRELA